MISVIVPVYNVEDYLHVCINSILNQTYQDFEIICVDDASTDSSLEILEYFSLKDSRVKVLKNDSNKGPGYSRNRGLDVAKGEYVSFLDADDWFSLDTFEILINSLNSNNLDLLIFKNILYQNESHDFLIEENNDFMDKFGNKVFNHFDLDKTDLFMMSSAAWNKIYLKSVLDENNIRFPNENIAFENYPFFYNVITSSRRISLINKCLYNKRERKDSLLNLDNGRLFDNINVSYLILKVFLDNFQLYQYYSKEVLRHIFQVILDGTYNQIKNQFKEDFFEQIQTVYKNFIKDYGLYEDIVNSVDESILKKFNFDNIANEIFNYCPKISFVIPVYNAEKYLEMCLDSVVNQTMEDIEIICINDGSSDSSLDILNKFRNKDYRINIFSQENGGPASARNIGIQKVTGEYVLFVDSDDCIESDMCEELFAHAKHLNSDLVLFDATELNLDNESRDRIYFPNNSFKEDYNEFTFDYTYNKNLVLNYFQVVWSKMYKQDLVKNIEFPDLPLFEDVQFHVESMLLAKRISYMPKLFYHYRKVNVQSEQNFKAKTEKSLYLIDVFNGVYKFLIENDYFDEFKLHFSKFVLLESRALLNRIDISYKQVLFERMKLFFNSADINLNELSEDLSQFYLNVVNNNTYLEFQDSQK